MKLYGIAALAALLFASAGELAEAKKLKKQTCVVTIEYDSGHFGALTKDDAAYFCRQTMKQGPKWRADPIPDGSGGIAFGDGGEKLLIINKN